MKFRAHDTFFIRKGWLSKGMRNVKIDPAVFMGAKGNPMDMLQRIIVREKTNIKTKQFNDTEMARKIKKMIEEEVQCY